MQRAGKIAGNEPNPAFGKQSDESDFERMRHIHKADSGKLLLQMPEIDVSKMSTSQDGDMVS